MSIAVVSFLPDVDLLLTQALRDYLNVDVGWAELFPNYGTVRVSMNHPFVELLDQKVNGTKQSSNLFPSVTLASVQDGRLPGYAVVKEENPIVASDLAEINPAGGYIVAGSQLTTLQGFLAAAPAGSVSQLTSVIRTHQMALEIWADNQVVKNKLFDLVTMGLTGQIRYRLRDSGLHVKEEELHGQRSGNYNMDFGKLYYGAALNFPVDVDYWQIYVDTTQVDVTQIAVQMNGQATF